MIAGELLLGLLALAIMGFPISDVMYQTLPETEMPLLIGKKTTWKYKRSISGINFPSKHTCEN